MEGKNENAVEAGSFTDGSDLVPSPEMRAHICKKIEDWVRPHIQRGVKKHKTRLWHNKFMARLMRLLPVFIHYYVGHRDLPDKYEFIKLADIEVQQIVKKLNDGEGLDKNELSCVLRKRLSKSSETPDGFDPYQDQCLFISPEGFHIPEHEGFNFCERLYAYEE